MKVIVDYNTYIANEDKLYRYFIKKVLNNVVLECDSECLEILNKNNIPYIEDKKIFKITSYSIPVVGYAKTETITLDRLFKLTGLDQFVENYNYPAFNILDKHICILDSGISDHPIFADQQVLIEKKYISKFSNGDDDLGHGTGVGSIISVLCPYSKIVSIKMFSVDQQVASVSDFLEALDLSLQYNCKVINASLGGILTDKDQISLLERELFYVSESDSVVISAVGNEALPVSCYPARSYYAIGVGSINSKLQPSSFNNFDIERKKPDFVFFGEKINVASLGGLYSIVSGTSFSTPVVSALTYWNYYFYNISKRENIPVGFKVAIDGSKRFFSETKRALIEISKKNNPLSVWNPGYGYGISSYAKLTTSYFDKSFSYRRLKPSKVTNIPFPNIIIQLPDKLINIPVIPTQSTYNYYYTNYYIQQQYTQKPTIDYVTETEEKTFSTSGVYEERTGASGGGVLLSVKDVDKLKINIYVKSANNIGIKVLGLICIDEKCSKIDPVTIYDSANVVNAGDRIELFITDNYFDYVNINLYALSFGEWSGEIYYIVRKIKKVYM